MIDRILVVLFISVFGILFAVGVAATLNPVLFFSISLILLIPAIIGFFMFKSQSRSFRKFGIKKQSTFGEVSAFEIEGGGVYFSKKGSVNSLPLDMLEKYPLKARGEGHVDFAGYVSRGFQFTHRGVVKGHLRTLKDHVVTSNEWYEKARYLTNWALCDLQKMQEEQQSAGKYDPNMDMLESLNHATVNGLAHNTYWVRFNKDTVHSFYRSLSPTIAEVAEVFLTSRKLIDPYCLVLKELTNNIQIDLFEPEKIPEVVERLTVAKGYISFILKELSALEKKVQQAQEII